uniref:Cyclin C-terminal domain-containing protein n=1 Tax=Oryza brachyantha TaxID=4533 RepID=J3KYU8_ORYBR
MLIHDWCVKFIILFLSVQLENMTFFYAELVLVQYSMLFYAPSVIAAAARCTLGLSPTMEQLLEHHTGLVEPQLLYIFFFTM